MAEPSPVMNAGSRLVETVDICEGVRYIYFIIHARITALRKEETGIYGRPWA